MFDILTPISRGSCVPKTWLNTKRSYLVLGSQLKNQPLFNLGVHRPHGISCCNAPCTGKGLYTEPYANKCVGIYVDCVNKWKPEKLFVERYMEFVTMPGFAPERSCKAGIFYT